MLTSARLVPANAFDCVKSFNGVNEFDSKLTFIKSAFKKYNNYDKNNVNEEKYHIDKQKFDMMCKTSADKDKLLHINIIYK